MFSLHSILESSLELISFTARDKNIELISNIDEDCQDWIVGDEGRIRQILGTILHFIVVLTIRSESTFERRKIYHTWVRYALGTL